MNADLTPSPLAGDDHEGRARAGAALAAAFAGDPPMRWFLADDPRREQWLVRFFAAVIGLYDAVDVTEHGAALWVAPGRRMRFPIGVSLRTFGRRPVRALTGQRVIERGHLREPHWYLDYVGVHPSAHGRGEGSALLEAGLARCDAPAYLHAGSPDSRRLYERHGFRVLEELRLPFGGPPMWRMIR